MRTKKGKQVRQNKLETKIIKTLSNLLAFADIKFGTNYNTLYRMPHFVTILVKMAKDDTYAEDAADQLRDIYDDIPTGRWFRGKMHSISDVNMKSFCDNMLDHTAMLAKSLSRCREGAYIAIDKHLIPRYDEDNMLHLVFSKFKNGTKKFESYVTMQLVANKASVVLDCIRETRSDSDPDFVRKFAQKLKKYRIRVKLLLMDREFYSVDIMNTINEFGIKFLMPAVKNSRIKTAIKNHHFNNADPVLRHTMKNSQDEEATFTLIITPSKKYNKDVDVIEKYVVFATNLPTCYARKEVSNLSEEYRKRWGIETGYRVIEDVRPKTKSRDASCRMILFFLSLFFYNMWVIQNARKTRTKYLTLNARMNLLLEFIIRLVGTPFDPGKPSPT